MHKNSLIQIGLSVLALAALLASTQAEGPPVAAIAIDGRNGGRVFDSIGIASGGGAVARLLVSPFDSQGVPTDPVGGVVQAFERSLDGNARQQGSPGSFFHQVRGDLTPNIHLGLQKLRETKAVDEKPDWIRDVHATTACDPVEPTNGARPRIQIDWTEKHTMEQGGEKPTIPVPP